MGLKLQPTRTYIHTGGYKVVNCTGSSYGILEHRKIIEEHLGRKLLPNEVVHHINGVKLDNRLENLIVMTRAEHINEHRDKLLEARDDIVRHSEESEKTECSVT